MKCSVIIPTLNEEAYIPKLLRDLSRQRSKSFEVIVIDGHSDDATVSKALSFAESLDITVVNSKKRNLSFQRNLGASHARGSYLIFLDADTRVNTSFISNIQKHAKKHKYLVMVPKLEPLNGSYIDESLFQMSNFFVELSQVFRKPIPSMGCMIFESSYFKHIGQYKVPRSSKKMFPEDQEIITRSRATGVIAHYLSDVVVQFSLRRFNHEGRLSVIRTYLMSTVDSMLKGEFKERKEHYEMGGHIYSKKEKAKYLNLLEEYREKFHKLQRQLMNKED